MEQEIERKFLVTGEFKHEAVDSVHIAQGYLSSAPERTVRIRVKGDRGFLTIKGQSDITGTTRFEWEKEIDVGDARNLLELCERGKIDKIRFIIPAANGRKWEVDEFHGDNEGLVVAELELGSADEKFERPSWLGREVTSEAKYYNAMLSQHPYKDW